MTFATLFCLMLVGHLTGDYLFQNEWMATKKSGKGWLGHLSCTVHVTTYTLAMVLALHLFRWQWHGYRSWDGVRTIMYAFAVLMGAIDLVFRSRVNSVRQNFVSLGLLVLGAAHFIIHPWLIAAIAIPHWLIDRTGFAATFIKWKNGQKPWDLLKDNEVHFAPKQVWSVAFAAPVYIVNDNTMHFLLMLPILHYLAR